MAHYIAFREENADEIRATCIKKNCQIFKEACQQMESMLLSGADAPAVALEILSGLTRDQIVLLSCSTIVARQCFVGVNSRDWTKEEKAGFVRKFTTYVDGEWDQKSMWNEWEHLSQVLFDEIWVKRAGCLSISKGYPAVWIWSKLDRLPRETEILRLELVIN
jgi:hypothetical protein